MKTLLACIALLMTTLCRSQTANHIRLNQIGYYPFAPKIAVVIGTTTEAFFITTPDARDTLFKGTFVNSTDRTSRNRDIRIADFSAFTIPGMYRLTVPSVGNSHAFEIKKNVHRDLATAALKGFYFQRASLELQEKYAGKWKRPGGHYDKRAIVHASAVSPSRPEGSVIYSARGWYDAGDYNRYIVNSGITMGTLLSLYEDFPAYCKTITLNIPESNNRIPDILDEISWNLRWMLTMQDPYDGGVYNKLTNANFDGMVMPHEATEPRYVVQKGTAATLDFAAVMAQASRIYKKFDRQTPGLADSCLRAAKKAWEWATTNSNVPYDQRLVNTQFDPDISTGGYGDRNFNDEFIWAACELYVTTGSDHYYNYINLFPDEQMPLPSWAEVRLLGYYTLLRHKQQRAKPGDLTLKKIQDRLVKVANDFIQRTETNTYRTVMGQTPKDFVWGSNSVAANQGILLIQVYKMTLENKYLQYALTNVDYLLGRNGTGYCYLTGYGDKSPLFPHHRPSEADGIEDPVPGLLVGGPNPGQQDKEQCKTNYPSDIPDEAYIDDACSYASNEIAINWNAPFAYLVHAIEALQTKAGYSK